jgi:transcriptional regulator with XRE-family HTH domain/tetratricopeptide (TPR) repeat protein
MSDDPAGPLGPVVYQRADLRKILAGWDIAALYRVLTEEGGFSQRQIAARTGQRQSEVAEILSGRRGLVENHRVLRRIAAGLEIAPEMMGLSWWGPAGAYHGPAGGYPEGGTSAPEGVNAGMLRRHLVALGMVVATGQPRRYRGELGELPATAPGPVPLPSRISPVHVAQVHELRQRLTGLSRAHGSDPELSSAVLRWAQRLLGVPAPAPLTQALQVAVAELQIHAGYAGFDAGLYEHATCHWARALELAVQAGDVYLQALALTYAGLATVEHGHPNEGLKLLQCAQARSWDIPPGDDRAVAPGVSTRAAVEACALADSALALERLGDQTAADRALGQARQLWTPGRTDATGDLDAVGTLLQLSRGQLDAAQEFARASVRRWENVPNQRAAAIAAILLATVHVQAGEHDGLQLAHTALTTMTTLSSARARQQHLTPLAAALQARKDHDAQHLARMTRQIITTRM